MSSIAETMTLKIIKQTIAELQENGALAMTPEECLAMFTKSAPQKKRVTLMGGYKKKKAAAAKKARKAMDKTATLILKADEKVKKQEAKEAKKELADRAALIKLKSKAGREIIQAGKVAKKKAAAELKAKKAEEKLAKKQEREAKKQAAAELKAKKAAEKSLKEQNPRPKGRAPKGKVWDYETGEWIIKKDDDLINPKLTDLGFSCYVMPKMPDVDEEVETVMLC